MLRFVFLDGVLAGRCTPPLNGTADFQPGEPFTLAVGDDWECYAFDFVVADCFQDGDETIVKLAVASSLAPLRAIGDSR